MSPFKRQSQCCQVSVFVRTSSGRFVLRPLFQRSCGSLGESSFSGLRCRRVSSSHRPTRRQANKHTVLAKMISLRLMRTVRSFIRDSFAQPAGNPHRPQILSGIMKSVAVALAVTVIPTWRIPFNLISSRRCGVEFIRIARKQPRIRKIVCVVRRKRQELQLVSKSLAFAAFSVFVVWDIRHLSHEEAGDVKIQKTVREDPAAALSNARKELARMLKDKKNSRC